MSRSLRIRTIARRALAALLVAALVVFLAGVRPPDRSAGGTKTVIRVWHIWGGPMLEVFRHGVDRFEQAHPDIACDALYVPNELSNNQKFCTAVAGNCSPEVMFVDGPMVAEWAERGLLTPLNDLLGDYLRERGLTLDEFRQEFFPPCWEQCEYRGKIWAITFCADPNFGFFWNKATIRKAIASGEVPPGAIDPDRPPQTLAELDRWNKLMVKRDEDGRLVRLGLVPWSIYGRSNSMFTWGWAFGGRFYDRRTRTITCDDPKIVAALEWMCTYARTYGVERIAGLQSMYGTAEQNPFITGKEALQLYHISGLDDLDRYAPHLKYGEGYGIVPIPQPEGGEKDSSWVGGWTLAIPAGVTDPEKRRAALEFILWNCATPEGTSLDEAGAI